MLQHLQHELIFQVLNMAQPISKLCTMINKRSRY